MNTTSTTHAATLADLLARAGYTCQCRADSSTACGKPHKPTGGMCITTNSAAALHVVARRDVPCELAATMPAPELMVLCDGCHASLLARRRKSRAAAPAPDALF